MKRNKIIIVLSLFMALVIFLGCQEPTKEANDDEQTNQAELNQDADKNSDEDEPTIEDEDSDDSSAVNGKEDVVAEEPEEEQEPLYQINQSNWAVEPISEDADENVVLLTFDDTPEKYGLDIAHILDELDAPAIFFVNGHFIQTEEQQDMLREIHELGFAIGNHTYTHPNLGEISEEEQRKEIVELNDLIEEVIGERPRFFRAPHGVNTDFSEQLVEEEGMVLMNWTYGYDYFEPYMDAEKLAEAMITGEGPEVDVDYSLLRPGANLLMHDREWTKDALADIVTGLREQGYEMVDPDLIQIKNE